MVFIMGNPMKIRWKMDDLGEPTIFWMGYVMENPVKMDDLGALF
jgi:hypothetical protein